MDTPNLPYVFSRLPQGLHEVIVVDGYSTYDTLETVRKLRPDVRIVMQNRRGKGNALACGFAAATGDIIAMIDADGSADPAEIPKFVQALLDDADLPRAQDLLRAEAAVISPASGVSATGYSVPWWMYCAARDIQISAMGIMPSGAAMFLCLGSGPNRRIKLTVTRAFGVTDSKWRR
jgi:glycosyltransferase involved in cell wall biosynthesis